MVHKCPVCFKEIIKKKIEGVKKTRSNRIFCSSSCRYKAYHQRKKILEERARTEGVKG